MGGNNRFSTIQLNDTQTCSSSWKAERCTLSIMNWLGRKTAISFLEFCCTEDKLPLPSYRKCISFTRLGFRKDNGEYGCCMGKESSCFPLPLQKNRCIGFLFLLFFLPVLYLQEHMGKCSYSLSRTDVTAVGMKTDIYGNECYRNSDQMNGWRSLSAKESGKNVPMKMESLLKGKSAGTKKDALT